MSKPAFQNQMSTEPTVPAWLDQQELQRLLKQDVPGLKEITSMSSKQEYFTQPALRLQVQAKVANTTRAINYLVKSEDQAKTIPLKFPSPSNFQAEFEMYDVVLPSLMEHYKNVDRDVQFSPSNFKLKLEEHKSNNCLYLDHVQAKGYRSGNQPNGLDRRAMEAALSKLAAYHAATVLYLQEKPSRISKLPKLLRCKKSVGKSEELKSMLQLKFHESLRANDLRQYEDKVKSFQRYTVVANGSQDINNNSFNVILNGACWPNNLLYQADAFGNIKDILFVDFHAAKYGPAVYDLFHLLLSAPCAADKVLKFDAYLKYYHEKLIENLQLLKFKGGLPKITDLQLDLLKYGHWGFEAATEILPIVLSDFCSEDLDELFKTPKYAEQIKEILPWLENRGFFEEEYSLL